MRLHNPFFKPLRVTAFLLFVLPSAVVSARAQVMPPTAPEKGVSSAPAAPIAVLPFSLESDHIILSLPLTQFGDGDKFRAPKDTPLFRLGLDTGADYTLIAQEAFAARKIVLPPKEAGAIGAMVEGTGNGGTLAACFVPGITFAAGATEFKGNPLVAPLGLIYQFGIDGILGAEVFRACVVEINYAAKTVRLFAPDTFSSPAPGSGFAALPIQFVGPNKRPVVSVQVTPFGFTQTTAHLTLDTGASGTIAFAAPFVKRNGWDAFAPQTVQKTGLGIGGTSNERRGRLKKIQLGGVSLANPYADFSFNTRGAMVNEDSDGLLGGAVLRRFTVIIDYRHAALYLRPNDQVSAPFPYRYYGLRFAPAPTAAGSWPILQVDANSPASRAGIKTGETLVAVDAASVARMTIDGLNDLLSGGKNGERVFTVGDAKGEKRREVRVSPVTL